MAVAPHSSTRTRPILVLNRSTTAAAGGLLGHLAEPSRELTLVVVHARALRERGVHQRRLDEALVREHLATVAGGVANIREHLVEEVLCEPARDPLAGLEVAGVRLKRCGAGSNLARGSCRGGGWARGGRGTCCGCRCGCRCGGRFWRQAWPRCGCQSGRWRRRKRPATAVGASAEAFEIARPPSLGVEGTRCAILIRDRLTMDVVWNGDTRATTSTALGGLRHGRWRRSHSGHRCRRKRGRRRRRWRWHRCWQWRGYWCRCQRRSQCGRWIRQRCGHRCWRGCGRKRRRKCWLRCRRRRPRQRGCWHWVSALAEPLYVAWPPRLLVSCTRPAIRICDALLLRILRLRDARVAETTIRRIRRQSALGLDHDKPNIRRPRRARRLITRARVADG
mmetsp:Transcript_136488/g.340346  ORF Transcript_136488/g.340346 Transcript_136488/m.340346 type:complete len:393 (+) Transcript_136488:890-2068(+)